MIKKNMALYVASFVADMGNRRIVLPCDLKMSEAVSMAEENIRAGKIVEIKFISNIEVIDNEQ